MTDPTNNHEITPPPELFAEWIATSITTFGRAISLDDGGTTGLIAGDVAIQAARWGADQELKACCEYIAGQGKWYVVPEYRLAELRAARRPKPPSLKEQALAVLDDCSNRLDAAHENTLRRALEQLSND